MLAVLLTQCIQLIADSLHQQCEIVTVCLCSGTSLVNGNTISGRIAFSDCSRILPVNIYEIISQIIDKLGNVLCKILSCGFTCSDCRKITRTGPATYGNTNFHVGVLRTQNTHGTQYTRIRVTIGQTVLFRQNSLKIGVFITENQFSVFVHIHESKIQMCNHASINSAGVIVFLPRIDRPITIINYITVICRCFRLGRGFRFKSGLWYNHSAQNHGGGQHRC